MRLTDVEWEELNWWKEQEYFPFDPLVTYFFDRRLGLVLEILDLVRDVWPNLAHDPWYSGLLLSLPMRRLTIILSETKKAVERKRTNALTR